MAKRTACAGIALFAFALAIRSVLYPFVFTDLGVRFPGGADEYYHLRRIWFTVENFPAVLDFDRYINFPRGARPPWPHAFDFGVAALARLLGGAGRQGHVEAVAVWVPPLLGALTVVAVAGLARRHFGAAAGWASGLLLAVLPTHILFSSLSTVDHHVAVALLSVLLVGAAMEVAKPAETRRWPAAIGLTAVLVAAMLLVWLGSLLEIVVLQGVLAGQLLLTSERAAARTRARGLAALHALAAILLAPFALGERWADYSRVSPLVLTAFHPLWLAAGAVAFSLTSVTWRWEVFGASRPRRIGTAVGLGVAGLAVAWLAIPALGEALRNAAGWFRADPFLDILWELQPLLFESGRFDPSAAHAGYSYLFWMYPLAAAWMAATAALERRPERGLLVIWSASFAVAALDQRRFSDLAGPGFALVVGPALAAAWREAAGRLAPARLRPAAVAACLLLGLLLSPSLLELARTGRASFLLLRGVVVPENETPYLRRQDVLTRLARWLREASPPTRGYLDAAAEPEYGVLAAWDDGHLLRYRSERPMLEDNFAHFVGRAGFDAARAYFGSADEDAALAIARGSRVRYVVATMAGSGQTGGGESMALRLALRPGPGGRLILPTPPLAAHRLVFVAEDSARARASGQRPEIAALYEIVSGARVVGTARPGESLRFVLRLELPDRTALFYVAVVQADSAGRYEIRLPYATEPSEPGAVRTAERYEIHAGEREATLALSLADIREGREVAGPSFAP